LNSSRRTDLTAGCSWNFGKLTSAAVFLLAGLVCLQAQTVHPFRLAEQPGSFAVGLKVVEQYDFSRIYDPPTDVLGRPFQGERARPLQTLIWYPAEKSSAVRMAFGDYVALEATQTSFGHPESLTGMEKRHVDAMKPSFRIPLWAVRDARPVSGQFPTVIYAPSYEAVPWENADLCEYLASFGYVVIASPGLGPRRGVVNHDVAMVDAQARDISFLIGFARTLPDANPASVAVVGFSWGGLSNLFAASRDDRIQALVALDGSMRYFPNLVEQAGIDPAKMTIPLLYFKGQHTMEDQDQLERTVGGPGQSVLNQWIHGDLLSVDMLGMVHPEFASRPQRNEALWIDEFPGLQEADYGREDEMVGYAWIARYTREFLDAYLKHSTTALVFLKNPPAANLVPLHVMATQFRPAQGKPVSFTSFQTAVSDAGFAHTSEVYEAFHKQHPEVVDAESVTAWAYALLAGHHTSEAVEIMKLAVQLKPSSQSYASLGEMYVAAGQKENALESYQKALRENPNNLAAKQGLDDLPPSH
jgi:pimeloyl-ACP methyl ester carboxylesterase